MLHASPSLTLCPLTSDIVPNAQLRLLVEPGSTNGLRVRSQVQVDKIQTVERKRVREPIGSLNDEEMHQIDLALAFHLNLYAPSSREESP